MLVVHIFLGVWLFVAGQHVKGNIVLIQEESACKGYMGQRPDISPLNIASPKYLVRSDPRVTSVHNNHAAGSAGTVNIYTFLQFNCSYDKPIHWVFQLDPEKTNINVEIDFSERRLLSTKQRNDEEPKYVYSTNFRLLYFNSDLEEDKLFSCEPVDISDPCERNFLQLRNGVFENDPTPFPEASLIPLSDALLKYSSETTLMRYFDTMRCPMTLILKVELGNVISFRWESLNGSIIDTDKPIQTNETTFFENVFLSHHKTMEPHCVRVLNDTEKCLNCAYVSQVINYTINAVAFRAIHEHATLIYKGLFSVPKNDRSERHFYFDWQISDSVIRKQMIKLKIPTKIYANVPFKVICRVSVLFFSYGTQIEINDQDSPEFDQSDKTREFFQPNGYREVVRTVMLKEADKVETVSCFSPLKKSSRWIAKSKAMLVENGTPPVIDRILGNTTIFQTISDGKEFIIAECNFSGIPHPVMRWILPTKLQSNQSRRLNFTVGENFGRITFPKWENAFAGTYICEATNLFGVTTKVVTFQHKVEESSSKFAIIMSSSLGSLTILLGTLIGVLAWKIRRQRLDFEIQTQKAIDEFRNGIKIENMEEMDMHDPNFSILQMSYNEAFEVPQSKWIIEDKILGTGQFGIVRLGSVVLKGEKITIAVKSLKSSVEVNEFKSFLFELKIMAYLGQHKNIVSLMAACTEGINNRDIVIGVEFCDNGCLLDYLRKYRGTFLNMVGPDGKIISDLSPVLNNSSQYANISIVSTHQLYRWAYHIACGMGYLQVKKVLHGDLAARNVLLTSRKVAKVGDFGLSRVLMNSENYTKKTQTALPWKWMALESLKSRDFSVYSDVWSYGICLYEIFTLGQTPYPGIGWSPGFITQLENGMRMEKPANCTSALYKIMRACWENDMKQRPNYAKIKLKLSKGLLRLSQLNKEQKEKKPVSARGTVQSNNSQPPAFLAPTEMPDILDIDDAGIYSNLPRRTMNYYKNC